MTKEIDVRDVVKLAKDAKLPKYMFDTNDGRRALMRFVALVVARTDNTEFAHQYTAEGRIFAQDIRDDAGDLLTIAEHEAQTAQELFE